MTYIEIPAADGVAEAYVARPESGSGPGVLLFMDAIGLRPQIAQMCDRIASWGYVVLAPNLFYRNGSAADLAPQADLRQPGAREEFFAGVGPRLGTMVPANILPDLDHFVPDLQHLDGVRTGPVAVVGYCMGARWATYAAGRFPDVVAVAAGFHGGRLVTDAPDSPHRSVASARAEFVYGHADHDQSMNSDAVAELGRTLQAAGVRHTNEVYAGASHGYSMADTSMYHQEATERSFAALHDALQRNLPA